MTTARSLSLLLVLGNLAAAGCGGTQSGEPAPPPDIGGQVSALLENRTIQIVDPAQVKDGQDERATARHSPS